MVPVAIFKTVCIEGVFFLILNLIYPVLSVCFAKVQQIFEIKNYFLKSFVGITVQKITAVANIRDIVETNFKNSLFVAL